MRAHRAFSHIRTPRTVRRQLLVLLFAAIWSLAIPDTTLTDLFPAGAAANIADTSVFFPDTVPPSCDIALSAAALDTIRVILSWETAEHVSEDAESIGVWYDTRDFPPAGAEAGMLGIFGLERSADTLREAEEKTRYYFTLAAADSAGNWSVPSEHSRASLTIPDCTPPLPVSGTNATALTESTAVVSWQPSPSDDIDSVLLVSDSQRLPLGPHDGSRVRTLAPTATSDTITGLKAKTRYFLAIFVADSAGNWATSAPGTRDSIRTPDQTPPAPAHQFQLTHVDKDTVKVSWRPSSSSDAQSLTVVYRTDGRFPRRHDDGRPWGRYDTETKSDSVTGLDEKQTYHATAFVCDSAGNWSSDTSVARDSLTIPDQTPPRNVSSLDAQAADNTTIALRWGPSVSSDVESVMVRYRTDGAFPDDTGSGTAAALLPSSATADSIDGLDEKVMYYIALFLKDSAGLWSPRDSSARDSVFTPDQTPPSSVTSFTAAYAGGDSVRLSWTPSSSPDAESTIVRYRADGRCPSGPDNGLLWDMVGAAVDSALVTDLLEKTTYHFTAFTRDSAGLWSAADTGGCDSARIPDLLVPHNVTHFSAKAPSNSSVALTWRPSASSDADSVMIRYCADGAFPDDTGDGALWRTVDNRFTTDTITDLDEKRWYHVGVFVRDRAGYWCAAHSSAQDSAFTPDQTAPDNVGAFQADYLGGDSASLRWSASPSADAESVVVRYATAGIFPKEANQGVVAGVFDLSQTEARLRGLADKKHYCFSAFVKDFAENWSRSSPAARDTFSIPDRTPPPAPREFSAGAVDHETIALRWKRPRARDVKSIMIRYRTDGTFPLDLDDGTLCRTVSNSVFADTLEGLREKVCYHIAAFAGDSAGLWSEAAPGSRDSACTPDLVPPANVTNATLTKIDGRKLALSWSQSPSADAESIMVRLHTERFPIGPEDGTQWDRYDLSVTADTLSGLTEEHEYHIGVFVRDSSGNWSPPTPSAQASAGIADIVPPRNVSGVRAAALDSTTVALSWQPSASGDVDSVIISYRTDRVFPTDTADGTMWARVPAAQNVDTVNGLAPDIWYMFGLFAKDSTGNVAVITGSSCAEVRTPK